MIKLLNYNQKLEIQIIFQICRAWNSSQPLAIFRPIIPIWPSKSNLLGHIYCIFPMGTPLIVYSNVPAFKEWPTNFKLLFQALNMYYLQNGLTFCGGTTSSSVRSCSGPQYGFALSKRLSLSKCGRHTRTSKYEEKHALTCGRKLHK